MTDDEAIAAVRAGGRAVTKHSLFTREIAVEDCQHNWRTIACDFDTDVIECSKCGQQQTCRCDFDEEFD